MAKKPKREDDKAALQNNGLKSKGYQHVEHVCKVLLPGTLLLLYSILEGQHDPNKLQSMNQTWADG